jgi:hypothetical protein
MPPEEQVNLEQLIDTGKLTATLSTPAIPKTSDEIEEEGRQRAHERFMQKLAGGLVCILLVLVFCLFFWHGTPEATKDYRTGATTILSATVGAIAGYGFKSKETK